MTEPIDKKRGLLRSEHLTGAGWDKYISLQDNVLMPMIGFGTQYGFFDDGNYRGSMENCADNVALALRTGFRLADTARSYRNEREVMRGIELSGVDRAEVFIITKAWPGADHDPGLRSSRAAIAESASRLGGYVDLYLVHQPVPGWHDLWRSLEDARDEGIVRAIGVSNFNASQLEELESFARYPPAANQIILHPFVYGTQKEVVRYCAEHDVAIIAYPRCPWQSGSGSASVIEIAKNSERSVVQVMLRWAVDHGCAVIPLSTNARHLEENLAVRDFRLSPADIAALDAVADPGPLKYAIDELNADYISGWPFIPDGTARITVCVEGMSIGQAVHGSPRPDVSAYHSGAPGAFDSGFLFRFRGEAFQKPLCEVSLAFDLPSGRRFETEKTIVPNPHLPGASAAAKAPALAPFPADIIGLLVGLRGEQLLTEDEWSDEKIKAAVDDIVLLARRGSRQNDGLFRYLRYLKSVHANTEFIARYFPRFNAAAATGAKESVAVAFSVPEMLSIANHLYVLKSRGLGGRLLEFGCFKGFSTACLSFICHELEIGFDVFDSFEGLPPSKSTHYNPGDFAGSLEEVGRNVREFGRIEAVTFHKGFFSDTLSRAAFDPLCIWMDVDLESSSRDVMALFPALRRESCVFSHEAAADEFVDGKLSAAAGPDSPLAPIAEAFMALGRDVRGRYLVGRLAAFWEPGKGIPVLAYEHLIRLAEL
jgi:O-methyltransferase